MKQLTLTAIVLLSTLILGCQKDNATSPNESGTNTSASGSLSLFTRHGNYLYKVENSTLSIFNVANARNPEFVSQMKLEEPVETIMADRYLFFGTETGMLIYSLTDPTKPAFISKYRHVLSCDPVVVKGNYAFVTLSAQSRCRGVNELHVVDISNITNPQMIKIYDFENPQGMAISGNHMFLCEGKHGLKVLDISNVNDIKIINQIASIEVIDAIYSSGVLTLRGPRGVYRYRAQDPANLKLLSYTGN